MGFCRKLGLAVNLVSYKSPLDFIPKFSSSFGEGIDHIQMNQPYIVETDTPLNTVITEMSKRKIGSAIVVKSGKLSGIVTTTDIGNALVELLESQFQKKN